MNQWHTIIKNVSDSEMRFVKAISLDAIYENSFESNGNFSKPGLFLDLSYYVILIILNIWNRVYIWTATPDGIALPYRIYYMYYHHCTISLCQEM